MKRSVIAALALTLCLAAPALAWDDDDYSTQQQYNHIYDDYRDRERDRLADQRERERQMREVQREADRYMDEATRRAAPRRYYDY